MIRLPKSRTLATLAVACIFLALPLVAAADGPAALEVAAGETRVLDAPLVAPGDVLVEGEILAAGDLVIESARDIVVRGRLAAGHGAPGEAGGSVVLRAARAIVLEEGAVVEAGAGGHGQPADVAGGYARGGDGGKGGDVVLEALLVDARGDVAPGMGGRGGDASGLVAVGGDGAPAGLIEINGRPSDALRLVPNPVPQQASAVCPPTDVQLPQLVMGANGGNACADGLQGSHGTHGQEGQDDEAYWDNQARPDCAAFLPGWQDLDGEQGENGYHGLPGGPALATGGKGGDAVTTGMQAGHGGNAVAHGGNGGNGGWGGMGGHAAGSGYGCRGGNGGNGAVGGSATATAGAQGINPLNCAKNGNAGTASATGGYGGSKGYGGGGGGGMTPSKNGPHGTDGSAGSQGYEIESTPATLPCLAPDAPGIVASDHLLTCNAVQLAITAPAFNGNSAITHYKIYRGTSPGGLAYVADVVYANVLTMAVDAPLVTNQTYYYRAKAVTAVGESPYSFLTSATPVCLVAAPGLDDLLVPIDPATAAPVLAATANPGLTATLTIAPPAVVSGTPLHYNIYRGPINGNEVFLTTTPYGGSTTTWVDSGLTPLTTYWYYVTLTTSTDTSAESNHAAVVTPLMLAGGGGSGTAQSTLYAEPGAPGKTRTCGGVPLEVRFTYSDGSFALDTSYGEGAGGGRGDDKAFCAETDAESRTYTSEGRSGVVDRETGASHECPPDVAQPIEGGWLVTRSCKSERGGGEHRVVLREGKEGVWDYRQDVYTVDAKGIVTQWSLVGQFRAAAAPVCGALGVRDVCV